MAALATVTLIEAFHVQPEADVDFIAGPQRAATLHRALRADVDLRYVCVARVESADPAFASVPFGSHASSYRVVREHRTPDVEGGVILIEPFELPEEPRRRGFSRAGTRFGMCSSSSGAISVHGSTVASGGPTSASSRSPAGRAR